MHDQSQTNLPLSEKPMLDDAPRRRRQTISWLRRGQSIIGLVAIVLTAIILSPRGFDGSNIFLDPGNLTDVLRSMSITGIMALAMTFVILTAGIDLSVGSIMALATVVTTKMMLRPDSNLSFWSLVTVSIAVSVVAATIAGALNGFLIAALRVPPFIVTLASMIGIRGFAKWLSSNSTVGLGFGAGIGPRFAEAFGNKFVIIWSFVGLAVVFWLLLARTVFGRYVRAIGDNEKAARYSGLPIAAVIVAVYTLSGMLSGIAGVLFTAKTNQSDPNAGMGYELDVIAAVVIGGTSLAGGRGSIAGTIIGAMIMGVLTNLLGLMNVDANVQMMIKAVIIIVAVWIPTRKKD